MKSVFVLLLFFLKNYNIFVYIHHCKHIYIWCYVFSKAYVCLSVKITLSKKWKWNACCTLGQISTDPWEHNKQEKMNPCEDFSKSGEEINVYRFGNRGDVITDQ